MIFMLLTMMEKTILAILSFNKIFNKTLKVFASNSGQ